MSDRISLGQNPEVVEKKHMLDTLDTSQSNGKKILMMGTDESSKLREASKTAGQKTLSYTFFL
jgi:hypothetical protein